MANTTPHYVPDFARTGARILFDDVLRSEVAFEVVPHHSMDAPDTIAGGSMYKFDSIFSYELICGDTLRREW